MSGADPGCRVDVWLWRARFFKTRSLAAAVVEAGRVRLSRPGLADVRLDKPSRTVRPGDVLVFVLGQKVMAVRVEASGERRGPAEEARTLYSSVPVGNSSSDGDASTG